MPVDVDTYSTAIGEMRPPSARISQWVAQVCERYRLGMTPSQQGMLETIARWSRRLEAVLSKSDQRITTPRDRFLFVHDDIGGPIEAIRANARMMLLDFNEDYVDWQDALENIAAAADYLFALRRDLQLKMHLEDAHDQS